MEQNQGKSNIIKILTREKFEKARSSGNYKEVSPEAQTIINASNPLDLLELTTQMGSTLNVISVRKIDEATFLKELKGE